VRCGGAIAVLGVSPRPLAALFKGPSRMPWVHVVACLCVSRVVATLACVSSQTSLPPWARHAGIAGAQGRAFEGWAEGPLEFAPTYKFRRGTSLYVGAHCRLQWGENAFLALGAALGVVAHRPRSCAVTAAS